MGLLLFLAFTFSSALLLDRPEPGLNFLPEKKYSNEREQKQAIINSFYRVLFDFGIKAEWISGKNISRVVRVPEDLPLVEAYAALINQFESLDARLFKAETNPSGNRAWIEIGVGNEKLIQVLLLKDNSISRINGKIAIVIDDFGYSYGSTVKDFLHLEHEITMSIIPNLRYSKRVAEAANELGVDVMLHMPMQPQSEEVSVESGMLFTEMDEKNTRLRMREAVAAVPHAQGLNNHMGSLATADEPLMRIVMDEANRAGLFFLDSKTNPKSVAYKVAKQMGLPCASNHVFLDNIKEVNYIKDQLNYLAEWASRNKVAIGIGHPEEATLKALQEEMAVLKKRGYKFVRISELVN